MHPLCVAILLSLLSGQSSATSSVMQLYHPMDGKLCIKSEFIRSFTTEDSLGVCAFMCLVERRCQAFTLADGPCKLFVFDKCSKSVRDCGCSRTGQLFLKQQAGLEAGALCPSGYGDDLCGVKYKIYNNTGNWKQGRAKCESESGLVIMADVMDTAEWAHVNVIYHTRSLDQSFYVGGLQSPNSAEPAGGWYWADCNIGMDASLTNGFDNYMGGENVTGRWSGWHELNDFFEDEYYVKAVLCECVSPFN